MTKTRDKEERGDLSNMGVKPEEIGRLRECSICGGPFDLDKEGGNEGYIGILPVAFCPTCKVGVLEFAEGYQPGFDCPHCGVYIGDE